MSRPWESLKKRPEKSSMRTVLWGICYITMFASIVLAAFIAHHDTIQNDARKPIASEPAKRYINPRWIERDGKRASVDSAPEPGLILPR